jgi:type IV fimbrial biogenesis protein FimT
MRRLHSRGFTLIELMVTLAVLAVLMAAAIPAFVDFRERAAVRGAGEELVSFWATAKLEAVKRDKPVTIALRKDAGGKVCLGASTTSAACDCFTPNATSNICDVAQFPTNDTAAAQAEWKGVTMVGNPTLGPTDSDGDGVATIDPKRGFLATASDVGGMTVQSPGRNAFRLRLYVDRWARPYLCAPTDSPRILPEYSSRTCAP